MLYFTLRYTYVSAKCLSSFSPWCTTFLSGIYAVYLLYIKFIFSGQASTKNAVSDTEKREKKMLEKKLAEMEEELKVLISPCMIDRFMDG